MATPEGATKLGSYLLLFKSKTNSRDCIISAHGGFMSEGRCFTVPEGVTLHFYGEHGASLIDPGISDFFRNQGKALATESIGPGAKCRNYLLSKNQVKNNKLKNSETYEVIKKTSDTRDMIRANHFKVLMSASTAGNVNPERAGRAWEQLTTMGPGGNCLTIRNRWNVMFGVPLADAIKAAKKEMPSLRDFHCIFCRSAMLPDNMVAKLGQTVKPDEHVNFGG